jgi:hypothetical protein
VHAVSLIESDPSRFHTPAKLATSTLEGYQASKALTGDYIRIDETMIYQIQVNI